MPLFLWIYKEAIHLKPSLRAASLLPLLMSRVIAENYIIELHQLVFYIMYCIDCWTCKRLVLDVGNGI